MKELIFLIEESEDGGYYAKALGESIITQGESIETLKINIIDAVKCHFEKNPPQIIRLHFVHDEVIEYA